MDPSPKVQLYEYGGVAPLADAVNFTCCPTCGSVGFVVKLTVTNPAATVV